VANLSREQIEAARIEIAEKLIWNRLCNMIPTDMRVDAYNKANAICDMALAYLADARESDDGHSASTDLIGALQSRLERAEQDAKRYRYLRSCEPITIWFDIVNSLILTKPNFQLRDDIPKQVDAAIDQALGGKE
jgi:hypothetical protein